VGRSRRAHGGHSRVTFPRWSPRIAKGEHLSNTRKGVFRRSNPHAPDAPAALPCRLHLGVEPSSKPVLWPSRQMHRGVLGAVCADSRPHQSWWLAFDLLDLFQMR